MAAPTIPVTDAPLKGDAVGPTFTGRVAGSKFSGTVTYAATEPPIEPPPSGGDWTPPSYLRTDTRTEAVPNVAKPAYLTPWTDPVFKTKVTRITGDPGTAVKNISGAKWGDVSRHHYNSDQAWNCDQSLLYLEDGQLVLDGETYEPKFKPTGRPSDSDVRWHAKDPALMVYASGSKYGTWNPKTGAVTIAKNFGGSYSGLKFGPWEGSPTLDGDMVVLTQGEGLAFAYKISTDKKYPDIRKSFGNARISPLGTYIVWGCEPDHVIITDLQGNTVTDLPNNYVSHFDVCVDGDGDEVLVGRNNGAGGGQSGAMTKYRLRDGKKLQLCSGGWCSHTSTRSLTRKYAVSAPTDEGGNVPPPYRGELIMSALDGSKTWRLGHTHEPTSYDYAAQTQPSHSPDGGRVIFASAWGGSGSTPRPVGCYVVDFRT